MVAASQKPILNRLLQCEPVRVRGRAYSNIDLAIADVGKRYTWDHLVQVLSDYGADVSRDTLRRWRREAA
jgi:hypothetical protein